MPAPDSPSRWSRVAPASARWLHLYISFASCALVLFFSITGLTLNHPDWFSSTPTESSASGSLNPAWLTPPDERVARLEIAEFLRHQHHLSGTVADFRLDDEVCSLSFKGPASSADISIQRASGSYEINTSSMGLVALLNDLHKGRDTPKSWSLVIDASAILLILVSLSGIILVLWMKRRRSSAFFLAAIATILSIIAATLATR